MARYAEHIRKIIPLAELSLELKDYLKDRSLLYEGQRRMEITSGVAQESILGPDL